MQRDDDGIRVEQIEAVLEAVRAALQGMDNSQSHLEATEQLTAADLPEDVLGLLSCFFMDELANVSPLWARYVLTNLVLRMPITDQASTEWARLAAKVEAEDARAEEGTEYAEDPATELTYQLTCEAKERAGMASHLEREILAVAMLSRLPKARAKRLAEAFR